MSVEKNTPNFLKHSGLSFTTIINETMNLIPDAGALGIYCYLASKPADWNICNTHLANRFGRGKEYVEIRINILKKLRLIRTIAIRDELGRIAHWETTLMKTSESNSTQVFNDVQCSNSRRGVFHPLGKPDSGKTATTNKRSLLIKENIQIKEKNYCSSNDEHVHEFTLFDIFWSIYPRKQGKQKAKECWFNKKLEQFNIQIMDDLKYRIEHEWKFKSKQHIPMPLTYLNGKRWNDERIESAPKQKEDIVTQSQRLAGGLQ